MFIVIVILVASLFKGTQIVIGDGNRKKAGTNSVFPSNPGGKNPGGQGPDAANDESSSTTFLDLNFGSRKESVVIFPINGDARKVFSYELATGSDFGIRDPTEWNVYGGQSADGPWTLFSHVIADAPSSRRASYGRRDTCLSTASTAGVAARKLSSYTASIDLIQVGSFALVDVKFEMYNLNVEPDTYRGKFQVGGCTLQA